MNHQKKQSSILTHDGLVLKGVDKLERINCDATRQEVILRTWQISRIVRRDYSLLAYKLFFAMRKPRSRRQVTDLLYDLVEEADVLESATRHLGLPQADSSTVLNLRIVSGEAQLLLDALVTCDKALVKMNSCEMSDTSEEQLSYVYKALARLKNALLQPAPSAARVFGRNPG